MTQAATVTVRPDLAVRNPASLAGRDGPDPALFLRRGDLDLLGHVSRYRELRSAARRSGLTEAAATRRIGALTRRLGAALVVSERSRTRLTTDGWLLYRSGRQLIDVLDHTLAGAHAGAGAVSRLTPLLRLATGTGGAEALVDLLSGLLPGVVVDLVGTAIGGPAGAFEQYRVDAACWWVGGAGAVPPRRPARLRAVLTEPLWVALPASHRHAASAVVPLADLAAETWVLAAGPDAAVPAAAPPRAARGPAAGAHPGVGAPAGTGGQPGAAAVLAAGSAAHQRSLVAQGQGVALVSPLAAPRRAGAGLVLRPTDPPQPHRLYLAVDPVTVPPPVADRLCAALRTHYLEQAQLANLEYANSPSCPAAGDPGGEPALAGPTGPTMGVPLQRIGPPPADPAGRRPPQPVQLEPEHLYLLDVVARAGSVNRAAAALLVSQPSLVRRLRRLEQTVGLTLLHASPRGSSLSDVARSLLAETADARRAFGSVVAQLRHGGAGDARPHLDIAT
jgi:DNA-binding transcriptional LysR family regulator